MSDAPNTEATPGSVGETPADASLTTLLRQIKQTLCVPAAEYVPAMADAMTMLDKAIQLSYQTDPRWQPTERTRALLAPKAEGRDDVLEEAAKVVDATTRMYGGLVSKGHDERGKKELQSMARAFSLYAAEVRALKEKPHG